METVDAQDLSERLQGERQDYWLHIEASSPFEKYPAKQHVSRVVQSLGVENGLIYLPGTATKYEEDSDQFRPFRQRRYFYYLSGVNEPDCHLTYDINNDILTLFIPRIDPHTVIWNGRGSTIAEAYEKYDVDSVVYTTCLPDFVKQWPKHHEGDIYILHPDQAVTPGQAELPRVDCVKLQKAINSARIIKDPHEIGLIRKANDITAKAHREVLANILKFKSEAQVEAIFLDTCISMDAKHQAYEPIAASGVNASTLHYVKNDEPLQGRQLMCLDAGCEWECYASDVTRTFPLSDSWPSKEAKQIHDLVQKMQDSCICQLAPGVRFLDLHIMAHHIAIEGLMALGILHNGSHEEIYMAGTSRAFFPHGLGHHIGLEVHDIGQGDLMSLALGIRSSSYEIKSRSLFPENYHLPVYDSEMCRFPARPESGGLEEGMVITVEPGIYFSQYALQLIYLPSPIHSKYINKEVLLRYIPVGGVRIEDDILITSSGHENLTTAPKGEDMLKIIKSQSSDASIPQRPKPTKVIFSGSNLRLGTDTGPKLPSLRLASQEHNPSEFGRLGKMQDHYTQRPSIDDLKGSPIMSHEHWDFTVGTSTNTSKSNVTKSLKLKKGGTSKPARARDLSFLNRSDVSCRCCRRRKIRCAGHTPLELDPTGDNRCSTCKRFDQSCTFSTPKLPLCQNGRMPPPCEYCIRRNLLCSPLRDPTCSDQYRCSNCIRFDKPCKIKVEPSLKTLPTQAVTTGKKSQWDGDDGLRFEMGPKTIHAQHQPPSPRLSLVYRHSVPSLQSRPEDKTNLSFAMQNPGSRVVVRKADEEEHSPHTTRPEIQPLLTSHQN